MTTPDNAAWIITGPTSGIGRRTALDLAAHGTVVLVGRSAAKLAEVDKEIVARGGRAVSVVCDLSDVRSARRAADQIAALGLPIRGLLNNAGIMAMSPFTTAQGWDGVYGTDHIGPFALTEALIPHLPDGASVVFIVSAVEDPDRKPAVAAGFRGARYLSAEASARGEWRSPGGSTLAGGDAYATAKQGNLATVFAFAREFPRLRFAAVEPGFTPGTGLGRDANLALRLVSGALTIVAPLIKYWSTPKLSARVITRVLTSTETENGGYYDETGKPMRGSTEVQDPAFQDRVVSETRALLATMPADVAD